MKNQPSLHECSQRVIFSKMKKDNSKKLVLLSYCLEDLTLKSLVDEAKSRNLPVEILESEREIFNAVQKYNAKYILGVCCPIKLTTLIPHLHYANIVYKAVPAIGEDECFKRSNKKRSINISQYNSALDWLCMQDS